MLPKETNRKEVHVTGANTNPSLLRDFDSATLHQLDIALFFIDFYSKYIYINIMAINLTETRLDAIERHVSLHYLKKSNKGHEKS